jgi:hypothetical protein
MDISDNNGILGVELQTQRIRQFKEYFTNEVN